MEENANKHEIATAWNENKPRKSTKQQPTGASIARNALSMCVCLGTRTSPKRPNHMRAEKSEWKSTHTVRDGQAQRNRAEWRQGEKQITNRTRVNTKFLTRVFSKLLPSLAAVTPWKIVRVCAWWHKAVVIAVRISHVTLQHAKRLLITEAYNQTYTHTHTTQTKWTDNMENRTERIKTNAFWISEAETADRARGKRTTFVCFGYTSALDSAFVRFVEWLLFWFLFTARKHAHITIFCVYFIQIIPIPLMYTVKEKTGTKRKNPNES